MFSRLELCLDSVREVHPKKCENVYVDLDSMFRNEHGSCLCAQKVLLVFLYVSLKGQSLCH